MTNTTFRNRVIALAEKNGWKFSFGTKSTTMNVAALYDEKVGHDIQMVFSNVVGKEEVYFNTVNKKTGHKSEKVRAHGLEMEIA